VLAPATDKWFAWTVEPPLTAAFLGAGYCAGFVLVAVAMRRRVWAAARIPLVVIFAFTALTLVATLLHLDRFRFHAAGHVARIAAWIWLVVYLVVPPALAAALVRQALRPGVDAVRLRSMPSWLVSMLAVHALTVLVVGATLFVAPETQSVV
jgi:hypothetical protein